MSFAKKMLDVKKKLEEVGHLVFLPCDIEAHLNDPGLVDKLELNHKHCLKINVMKECFDLVAQSDAILVLNYLKNGISGYIGTSSLMEIGLAYHLNKKIFLLFKTPSRSEARWAHEVAIINPVVLNGSLQRIR